jgi:two-component system, cell cycle sensor histidine kinase and response regulator CckA
LASERQYSLSRCGLFLFPGHKNPRLAVVLLRKQVAIGRVSCTPLGRSTPGLFGPGQLQKMKILLVEDHQESRKHLQRLLEGRGHEITAVESAEKAEAALLAQHFPFLILDWMLPGKSGLELCRELRAQAQNDNVFILLVTARAEAEDLEQALEAGANDYLTKPLDLRLLSIRLSVAERRIEELAERAQARAELQETVKRMVDILENTSDGFFALDWDWKFTYLNPPAETMLGRSREELLGQDARVHYPSFIGSVLETKYSQMMDEQVAMEFEATDSTTGKNWYEVKAYPSRGGISVFFRNITERKRLEEERLTTGKLESLGTLAGGIAHDLNNILTVISGNIGLAQIEAPKEAQLLLTALSKAGQAAQHAVRLSGQLLTFSKGGAPVKQIASLEELLRQSVEFCLYGSNLHAQIDFPHDLWKTEVDRGQMEQVVNGLVMNAREAMPHGGTVTVTGRNIEVDATSGLLLAPGRYVKIAICDKGAGIDEALAKKIFDPYFTTKPSGSGLGLSIGYSIIKKHGGLLQLESSSAEGSTFVFYLPAAVGQTVETAAPVDEPTSHCANQRILVMDDEAAIRDLTSQLLGTLGYEVTTVPDGQSAVQTYECALKSGENFQAVILDATVRGGMGGLATIERLRSLDPEVTAIICSGYSDESALAQFLAYGFRGALPKPFSRAELADALERVFETRSSM